MQREQSSGSRVVERVEVEGGERVPDDLLLSEVNLADGEELLTRPGLCYQL